MHHERIGPSPRQPFGSEAIEHVIFARGGDECAIHPFMLKAQHHHYISAFQPFVEISESSRTHLLYGFRHQGRRGDHADLRAQGRKADDVGACHATMQHIAAYRDYQSLDMPLAPSDGERRSEEHTSELQSLM